MTSVSVRRILFAAQLEKGEKQEVYIYTYMYVRVYVYIHIYIYVGKDYIN